ncbi:OLC1v1038520C2 [Oldenlandia corymbosa var. corymbosa]|nr:OLC1v1038520C2 [Oldenlandia corymbosa var. corymbosa]
MLVALCEEAVEKLSSMNHPDGDCPLCLYPLLVEEEGSTSMPFMKLMSCFHCFHCECIIRWYSWLQTRKEVDHDNTAGRHEDEDNKGQCPVCRKVFLPKDIEHVLHLAGTSDFSSVENDVVDEEDILLSNSEKERRQKFEAILKLQQENSGLIEPKRHEVLLPGVYLPRPAPTPAAISDKEAKDQQSENAAENSGTTPGGSSNRPSTSKHRNFPAKKHYRGRGRNPGKNASKWTPKESGAAS